MEDFRTIYRPATASFVEKKSEFIGAVFPVTTNDEAVACIESVKAQHRKAKHNVYAYILREDHISRYSDDGEPQGTGGVPVLDVLQKQGMTDICCVVTRYFGGILLGGGGLVRAYSHAASIALDAAQKMQMCYALCLTVTVPYTLYGKMDALLQSQNYPICADAPVFESDVQIPVAIPYGQKEQFTALCIEATNGLAVIQYGEEKYVDFSK